MYLNSTTNQPVWICFVCTIEKQVKKIFPAAKQARNNEDILKSTVRFKNLRPVFQTLTNRKILEITYARTTQLINAQHLTLYIVNYLCCTPK